MSKAEEVMEGPRSFARVIAELNHGSFEAEMAGELHQLLDRLAKEAGNRGKAKGKIGITLAIEVAANGVVTITSDKKIVEPKVERGQSIFWLTRGGNLTNQDPKQTKLPLREVEAPRAAIDIKTAQAGKGAE